jgi:hypothetical protein
MFVFKLKMTAAVVAATVALSGSCWFTLQALADKPPETKAEAPAKSAAADPLTVEQFATTHALIKPQRGESRWAEVPWFLSVHDARKKAAAEGKPIFIWAGGGAPPIGIC